MLKFRFTVEATATRTEVLVEWLEFATHFEANSYGMRMQGEGRPHGLSVYWNKI